MLRGPACCVRDHGVARQAAATCAITSTRKSIIPARTTWRQQAVRGEVARHAAPGWSSGVGSGTQSLRIVCDDGVVRSSMDVVAMTSPMLRSRIATALQRLEPAAPAQLNDDQKVDCYLLDGPLEIQVPGMTVEEWNTLLKFLSAHLPQFINGWGALNLTPDTITKVLPLAHKAGMMNLATYLGQLQQQLEAEAIARALSKAQEEDSGDEVPDCCFSGDEASDWEDQITVRGKWMLDNCDTVDEIIERLQDQIEYFKGLKEEGWELTESIGDDYGHLMKEEKQEQQQ